MAKEWASWRKFSTVEFLSEEQVQALPDDTPIVGTPWAHTDKNVCPRLLAAAMSRRTGKTPEQIKKEYPFEAKSRMVAQGHQEEQIGGTAGIRTDSPTASLLAFNLICSVAALRNLDVWVCDASRRTRNHKGLADCSSFVHLNHLLLASHLLISSVFGAKGSIYGTKHAGRSRWKRLFKTVLRHGWRMSKYEPALPFPFYLLRTSSLVSSVMASRVGNLLRRHW